MSFNSIRARVSRKAIIFHIENKKLYVVVGVEGIGSFDSMYMLGNLETAPFTQYIQICGVTDENKRFVHELESKITEKLGQNPNIKFLTPSSSRYDIK